MMVMIGGKGFQCNMRMNPNCLGGSLNASQYVDETASSKIPNFLRAVCAGGGGRSRKGQDKQAAANGACFIFNWGISSTTTQLWFLILMLVRLCSEWGALTRSYSIPRPLSHHTLSESPFKSLLLMRFASMAFTSCHHRPRSCLRPHRCSACCARRPPGRAKQSRRLGL